MTGESHHSFNKIAHMTGLGRRACAPLRPTANLKMDLDRSCQARGRGSQERIRAVHGGWHRGHNRCRRHRSFARFGRASAARRVSGSTPMPRGAVPPFSRRTCGAHLAGIEAADSITCDAHKWFSVPMGAGMFFCRHRGCRCARRSTPRPPTCPPRRPGLSDDPYTTTVAVVAPVYRLEALPVARPPWRSWLRRKWSSTRPVWVMCCGKR